MQKLYAFVLVLSSWLSLNAQLTINEIMQSNVDCVLDDTNEFPDSWVEIFNGSLVNQSLSGYSLGLTDNPSEASPLPNVTVPSYGYVVIYCDKKTGGNHLPFRVESGKNGALYLFKGKDIVDSAVDLPKMITPNVSLGRSKSGQFVWQLTPTPGAENDARECKGILSEPQFSHVGKVNPDPFTLDISVMAGSPKGTVIRYTLDGRLPTADSPVWKKPVKVDTTTVVRAAAFCDGYLSPFPVTQSYIFLEREMTLPVISLTTDSAYFYGDKLGILVKGNYNPYNYNYNHNWRRPLNFEIFENENHSCSLSQLCEARVKGGGSRYVPLKALAFYSHKRFGEKHFKYEFFHDDAPDVVKWKSFELRNSGNDFYYLYFRDALIQRLAGKNLDIDWQFYRPAIIYKNGVYQGLLNIRPRSNDDLIYSVYGLEDIDLIEKEELKAGTIDEFLKFKEFYSKDGNSLSEFKARMDVEEYTNLMMTNILFDNKDFPGNNITCWRPRTADAKWRWIMKDTDFCLGLEDAPYDFKYLNWLYDPNYDSYYFWANKAEHTLLFRQLMAIDEFRNRFINKSVVALGDIFSVDAVLGEMRNMYEKIAFELPNHRKLYNKEDYSLNLERITKWYTNRVPFMYNHFAEFFGFGDPVPVLVNVGVEDSDKKLSVNGIDLVNSSFDGQYFKGKEFNLISPSVNTWFCRIVNDDESVSERLIQGDVSLIIPEDARKVVISSEGWPSELKELVLTEPVSVFDCNGRSFGEFEDYQSASASLVPGIYIFRQGANTFKRVVMQ